MIVKRKYKRKCSNSLGIDETGRSRYSALDCGHPVSNSYVRNCFECGVRKEIRRKQFCKHGHDTYISGRATNGSCRACIKKSATPERRRNWNLSKYGINQQDYLKMLELQNKVCAICGKIPQKVLFVDHDHNDGRIRKLLCHHCNLLIGHLEYSGLAILRNALEYLSI